MAGAAGVNASVNDMKALLSIRQPQFEHVGQLADIQIRCWRDTYAAIVPESVLNQHSQATQEPIWLGILDDRSKLVFAAFHDDKPIGYIVGGPQRRPIVEGVTGHIEALYVLRAYQGRQIGRRLVAALADTWRRHGGASLSVGVLVANQDACRFYERLGGQPVARRTFRWGGQDLPQLVYLYENLDALGR